MQLDGWECPRCHKIWGPLCLQCLHCNDTVATLAEPKEPEPANPLVARTILGLAGTNEGFHARLSADASRLARAGYQPNEIAAMLEAGGNTDG